LIICVERNVLHAPHVFRNISVAYNILEAMVMKLSRDWEPMTPKHKIYLTNNLGMSISVLAIALWNK